MTGARKTDPSTSHEAARAVIPRAGTQCAQLLIAFAHASDPMISVIAAQQAGLNVPVANWWKRCSDLRDAGLIEWAVDEDDNFIEEKSSRTGKMCRAWVITAAGKQLVRSWGYTVV